MYAVAKHGNVWYDTGRYKNYLPVFLFGGEASMYHVSDFTKNAYRVKETADILGVTPKTIRLWDNEGKLKTTRSEGNQRLILREDLIGYLKSKDLIVDDSVYEKHDVIYARVSSHDQKDHGDLDRQALFLIEHINNAQNPVILKEVGSGLNDNRKQLKKLLSMVCNNEVRNVYVTYRDRLTRFGFRYLETMFLAHGVNIIIVKDTDAEKNVQEELVEDIMSLMTSFSGKLYGMRSRTNKEKNKKHEDQ